MKHFLHCICLPPTDNSMNFYPESTSFISLQSRGVSHVADQPDKSNVRIVQEECNILILLLDSFHIWLVIQVTGKFCFVEHPPGPEAILVC